MVRVSCMSSPESALLLKFVYSKTSEHYFKKKVIVKKYVKIILKVYIKLLAV